MFGLPKWMMWVCLGLLAFSGIAIVGIVKNAQAASKNGIKPTVRSGVWSK